MVAICGLLLAACETENGIKKGEIFITSETNIEVGLYAGEFVIDYAVKGYEDVDATITTTSEWLRVKENRLGKATIQYEENTSGGMRQAAVMLSYEGSTATVVVSQSNEAVTPILTLKSEENVAIDRCGQMVVISYSLENANPVDYVFAKTAADWIYSIDTNRKGIITLGVGTNTTKAMRETEVTVGYGTASFKIHLSQRGDGDANFKASIMGGEYLGDALTPGAANYWFFLSDRGFDTEDKSYPNATYYRIDAYGPLATGSGIVAIPDGTYTYDPNNTYAQWTFTAEWSGHWVTDANAHRDAILKFEEATLVVEGNKITLNAKVNGEQHTVVYEGENALLDSRGSVTVLTTLDGDYEAVVALDALDVALGTLKESSCDAHLVALCPLLAHLAEVLHTEILDGCYADKHLHLLVGNGCGELLATVAIYHRLAHKSPLYLRCLHLAALHKHKR